jgi:hypothetical protein
MRRPARRQTIATEVRGLAAYRRAFDKHQVIMDDGRWAAANGYDAIDVPSRGHMVVLNRRKVTVQVGGHLI